MAKGKERNPLYIDTTTASELLEVVPKTIIAWEKSAGRELKSFKVSHGIYHLKKLLTWWLENIYESKAETKTEADSRERYWSARAEISELDVQERKGELFPQSELLREWITVFMEFRQGCLGLGNTLPALLEGKTRDEMRVIINGYHFDLLTALARKGELRPAIPEEELKVFSEKAAKKTAKPKVKPVKKKKKK